MSPVLSIAMAFIVFENDILSVVEAQRRTTNAAAQAIFRVRFERLAIDFRVRLGRSTIRLQSILKWRCWKPVCTGRIVEVPPQRHLIFIFELLFLRSINRHACPRKART